MRIPEPVLAAVATLTKRLETLPASVFLGAFVVLISRYAAERELLLGVELEPGRRVPLRSDLTGNLSFEALVRELDERVREGLVHFDALALTSSADRVGVAFRQVETGAAAPASAVELTLDIRSGAGGSEAVWTHHRALFDEATIARISRHFLVFVETFVSRPERPVREVPLGDAVGPVGDPGAPPPAERTVLNLLAEQVARAPDAIAVWSDGGRLSYAELDARSERASACLRGSGVKRGDCVAVHMRRSPELVVTLVAVAKAGAAFVALDVTTPPERVRFMLRDCGARICVVEDARDFSVEGTRFVQVASLDTGDAEAGTSMRVGADDLAYVIYTSGSTGQPKGVMVEHASLLNYIVFYGQVMRVGPRDRVLQFASPSFDVSVEEIFGTLCHGATLVLRADDVTPRGMLAFCQSLRVSVLSLPTAYWNEIVRSLAAGAELPSDVRLVVIGGERASGDVLAQWQRLVRNVDARGEASGVELFNMYGPTEATISATYADLTKEAAGEPPIGRPVTGAVALVVDADGHPVPVGVPGELLLGGRCLARGYLNRAELTAERFTPSALVRGRFYHTGDLVRWRSDERLEYLGRIDQQVKIRGFRVELGEIESVLRAQPGVDDVVVVLRDEEAENPRLVAYVGGNASPAALRSSLGALPEYMLPSVFVVLDKLPLTRSGKIDRRALPAPQSPLDEVELVAPKDPIQATLVDIWRHVLRVDRLGIDHNFFALGGHSLLATQVISRIKRELGLELAVRDVFEAPTVERLAERLRGKSSLFPRTEAESEALNVAPLSFSQTRLWFLDQLEPASAAYNMPFALRASGTIDAATLDRALSALAMRHAILRTVFKTDPNGQPVQIVEDVPRLALARSAVPAGVDPEAWMLDELHTEASRPFDLSQGPLIRARLLSLGLQGDVLLFNMHHIVSDGWSIGILGRDLAALYRSIAGGTASLPELPLQYANYAAEQRGALRGHELERLLSFWKGELDGAPFRLDLPRKPPANGRSQAGATLHATLDLELAGGIDALAVELGATPFMVLLAAFAVLLSRVSGQTDLVIGTPVANRQRLETEDMIGLFVNTLCLRAVLREGVTFAELVADVRERVLRTEAHVELPFETLVDALHVERDLERSPIFQVMFAMQHAPSFSFDIEGLGFLPIDVASNVAKFELTLSAERTSRGYATAWEYRTELFDAAFVESLTRHFACLLQALVEAPDRPCARAPLVSNEERREMLVDWNRTERAYPDLRVDELVEAQARRAPNAVAVSDEAVSLTYAELERQAHELALLLVARGAKVESRVAIALGRSVRLVVALLAVQKAGGAYVPLDPSLPKSRMRDILEDANVALVLTESAVAPRIPEIASLTVVCIDQVRHDEERPAEILRRGGVDCLAYVMFTSGSTGRPKGVEITHRALVNLLCSMQREPGILPSDVVLSATSLGFDIAGLEIYLPLMSGASLRIASRELATDGMRLAEALDAGKVTFFQGTPSTYKMLLSAGFRGSSSLKLLVGGEQLPLHLAERLLSCCSSLWNVYGPTETTIWSTCAAVTRDALASGVNIGKPIANTQAYVLDARLEPVPVGVLGELYLGGQGLARGYAGRPDLTAERFLPNPFGKGRIYRTGDVVRYLRTGALECLGRVDHQVKIRGFRIELGDIEAAIRRHHEVVDVAVLVQTDRDDERIVAYVAAPSAFDTDALRRFVREALPDYMLPAHYVVLDRLPTTPNGKLDRKALPRAEAGARESGVAPRDDTERGIAAVFAELLGVPQVGVFDNFFDLGGNSLLGTELVFRLRQKFAVDLAVKTLFEAPNVAALAEVLRAPPGDSRPSVPKNVVVVRRGGGVPWFCFPALAGTAAPYLSNVAQGTGATVYALEAPGLDGTTPIASVETLARVFADAIRSVAPSGPIRLAGWSFGAVTAFAAARDLSAGGRDIEELLLVDPAIPGTSVELDDLGFAATFLADVAESMGQSSALEPLWQAQGTRVPAHAPADLFRLARELGLFPRSMDESDIERRFSVYTASARALREFELSPSSAAYAGKALILAASEGNGHQSSLWLEFLPGGRSTPVEASHYTVLRHLREVLR